jgi:hypothetical protein
MKPTPAKPRISIAHVEGSGTARIDPNSPSRSPLMPSIKNRVFGSPLLHALPKASDQRPPGVWPLPGSMGIVPRKAPVVGSKALISLARKLKLPTSKSPPNGPKPKGARVIPQGAASGEVSGLPVISLCRSTPFHQIRSPHPYRALPLSGLTSRVSNVDISIDVLDVERDQSSRELRINECSCAKVGGAKEPLKTSIRFCAPFAA